VRETPPTTAVRVRSPVEVLARVAPFIALLAGAVLLVAAEFSTLYEIRALDAVLDRSRSGEHHGYALLVVAVALVPMAWGAVLRRARPAAVACVVLAAVAVGVVGAVDAPAVGDAGTFERRYELVEAGAREGFSLGIVGAALVAVGALWTLVGAFAAAGPGRAPRAAPPEERPAAMPASHRAS
jgi:hypothetical protein